MATLPIVKGSVSILDPRNQLLMVSFYPELVSEKPATPPSLSLKDLNILMRISMQTLGGTGFFVISPLTKEVEQCQHIDLNKMDNVHGSGIGYFDINNLAIENHFDLRRRFSSYAEWVIGSCEKPFVKPGTSKWYQPVTLLDTDFLFTQIDNIKCLSVFYGETGELIFYTRIFDSIDEYLIPLQSISENLHISTGRKKIKGILYFSIQKG